MDGQDWTTVTFTKTTKQKNAAALANPHALAQAKATGAVSTERRIGAAENKSAHSGGGPGMRRLEESTEEFKHDTVNKTLSKAITQARIAKKLTQAQLAQAINERPQIIQQYENAQAVPNGQILAKLDRALGTHLPRK